MALWPVYLIAITSTVCCFILWFRDVRRIMRERKSTVESAAGQLAVWREKARKAPGDPDAVAVLTRSEDIYRQAVDIYNKTLGKPWNYLPARLMGFHYVS